MLYVARCMPFNYWHKSDCFYGRKNKRNELKESTCLDWLEYRELNWKEHYLSKIVLVNVSEHRVSEYYYMCKYNIIFKFIAEINPFKYNPNENKW